MKLYVFKFQKRTNTTIDAKSNLFTEELLDLKILPGNLLNFVKTGCRSCNHINQYEAYSLVVRL